MLQPCLWSKPQAAEGRVLVRVGEPGGGCGRQRRRLQPTGAEAWLCKLSISGSPCSTAAVAASVNPVDARIRAGMPASCASARTLPLALLAGARLLACSLPSTAFSPCYAPQLAVIGSRRHPANLAHLTLSLSSASPPLRRHILAPVVPRAASQGACLGWDHQRQPATACLIHTHSVVALTALSACCLAGSRRCPAATWRAWWSRQGRTPASSRSAGQPMGWEGREHSTERLGG